MRPIHYLGRWLPVNDFVPIGVVITADIGQWSSGRAGGMWQHWVVCRCLPGVLEQWENGRRRKDERRREEEESWSATLSASSRNLW